MGNLPSSGNNQPKGWLIPRTPPSLRVRRESCTVSVALFDELMSDQLVGRVTAYQGFDG